MTTEDDFHAILDANPDDHHTRLVFADWLQDRGDARAEGYRALGVLEKYPSVTGRFSTFGGSDHPYRFDVDWMLFNKMYLLPYDWFRLMPYDPLEDWKHGNLVVWRRLATRRKLEDAATLAFAKLPESRRRELLEGKAAIA
jgi:uncharacterized protein (TIGR02996 family)